MPIAVGWLGLGTRITNLRLNEPRGYVRPPITFFGHPSVDRAPQITVLEDPRNELIRYGGLMDSLHQGRCLFYWRWLPPWTGIGPGASFPPTDINVCLDSHINLAVNLARSGGAPDITITGGNTIGTVNGQPLVAGLKLAIESATGLLIPVAAVTKANDERRRQALHAEAAAPNG